MTFDLNDTGVERLVKELAEMTGEQEEILGYGPRGV